MLNIKQQDIERVIAEHKQRILTLVERSKNKPKRYFCGAGIMYITAGYTPGNEFIAIEYDDDDGDEHRIECSIHVTYEDSTISNPIHILKLIDEIKRERYGMSRIEREFDIEDSNLTENEEQINSFFGHDEK